jgi:hypothetical protein
MKRQLTAMTLITMLSVASAAAQTTNAPATDATATNATGTAETKITSGDSGGRFGAGLILGEPTGATLKFWFNETLAIDGAVGWSFHRETDLYLHSDVLWHKFDLIPVPEGQLPLYFGVGARAKFRDDKDDRYGIRVPVGVSYIFEDIPVDVFLEVAPIIDFAPSTRGGFTAGVGARFWF